MNRSYPSLDRLEARLDQQAARLDALYRMLEEHGIVPARADAGDAFFDELVQIEDAPLARAPRSRPVKRRSTRSPVGHSSAV
jgi:hypothetical protein